MSCVPLPLLLRALRNLRALCVKIGRYPQISFDRATFAYHFAECLGVRSPVA
jgi:hypothetical protein